MNAEGGADDWSDDEEESSVFVAVDDGEGLSLLPFLLLRFDAAAAAVVPGMVLVVAGILRMPGTESEANENEEKADDDAGIPLPEFTLPPVPTCL